ncbi:MAG: DUF1800 domain-containing protein [Pseudanabaenaceae cyanobacterium SKYGB_i_bin29]|nr:DUF1800 domain-containing protein [Pseudanabaenaceae cyanobacterium SKYG29]MDW8420492.1 DUF1800 domain-containing protein [Pseudanabaenaceae cyanobacterium SKYGB_i_bin29]
MNPQQQKAHFLRRSTGGGTLEELNSNWSPIDYLERWLNDVTPDPVPSLPGLPSNANDPQLLTQVRQQFLDWLTKQTFTATNPLHERIVSFWRDHFVISLRKTSNPYMLLDYERRLRNYALGDFQDLLWQVTTSPAMLHYLDSNQNRKGNINENYSREVMELFTIGIGNYTETDVQEGARALTGWTIQTNFQEGSSTAIFRPSQHDNGVKTFLGKRGNFRTEDIVQILANHPQTGRQLGAKLWRTFVHPHPEPHIVERLGKVYQENDRSIAKVLEAIFTSDEFYSDRAYRSQIRTPQEFMVAALRQLQVQADPRRVNSALRSMGQAMYNPPTVKGWANDEGWLTASSLLSRLNIARQITLTSGDMGGFKFDRQKFSQSDLIFLLLDNNPAGAIPPSTDNLAVHEFAAVLLSTPLYQLA